MEEDIVTLSIDITKEEEESFKRKAKKMGYKSNLQAYALKILSSKHYIPGQIYNENVKFDTKVTVIVDSNYYNILIKRSKRLGFENDIQPFFRKLFFTKYFVSNNPKKNDKEKRIGVRMSEDERHHFEKKAETLGMSMSDYFRQLIFKKDILITNPDKLIDELYLARSEVNKIGSNINQIANYANFLLNKDYLEEEILISFKQEALQVKTALRELRDKIDKTIKKV